MILALVLLILKITVLLALAWIAARAFRNRSADLRHRVWALALGGALVLPVLTATLPGWQSRAVTRVVGRAAVPLSFAPASRPASPMVVNAVPARKTVAAWIGFVWLIGAAFMLLRLGRGLVVLWWISARGRTILHNAWMFAAVDAGRRLGISRAVRLLESRKPRSMPLTWGFFRPTILLPPDALEWDEERRNLVLMHELAHVARADWPIQMLAELARAVFWFHPLVWLAANRIREESEQAADDTVLNAGVSPAEYATQLLDLARTLKNADRAWSTALAMARTRNLERRFTAMLNPSLNRRRASRPAALFTTAAALALLLPLAALKSPAQDRAGRFTGSILDPRSAVVVNATVILSNPKTGTKDMITSDSEGRYVFTDLPAGDYAMSVLQPGFAPYSTNVSLPRGQDSVQNVSLAMGAVNESVRVTAAGQPQAQIASGEPPHRIRVGGNVMATKLLRQVKPPYPPLAKQAGIQGSVLLQGTIGTDGRVTELTVLNSQIDPDLARASVEAVQQWIYQPVLLNGEPIEVITNITVNFTLTQ